MEAKIDAVTKKVIEFSLENTAGTVLSEESISAVVRKCYTFIGHAELNLIDDFISQIECGESGYLIKAADVYEAIVIIERSRVQN